MRNLRALIDTTTTWLLPLLLAVVVVLGLGGEQVAVAVPTHAAQAPIAESVQRPNWAPVDAAAADAKARAYDSASATTQDDVGGLPTPGRGFSATKRRGPVLWPNGPHNETIQRRIDELLGEGYEHLFGGSLTEEFIPTPGGVKSARRPDITMRSPAGDIYRENVGKSIKSGDPVARERYALDDLEAATGERPGYTPYDRSC